MGLKAGSWRRDVLPTSTGDAWPPCLAQLPSSHSAEWWCWVTQPWLAAEQVGFGGHSRRSDDSRPLATLQLTQNLRLCTQEAQSTACWRIFGHTSGSRGSYPITQRVRDVQCSASVKSRATHAMVRFWRWVRHQQHPRTEIVSRAPSRAVSWQQVICRAVCVMRESQWKREMRASALQLHSKRRCK